MKLNTDIGRLVKEKKETYPTKKRMNLYFKVDRTTAPATAALYISFVVVVLVALSKVMILDPWLEVRGLEEQARQLEEENAALLLQLKDFSKVQEEYLRIAPTEEEQAQGLAVDRRRHPSFGPGQAGVCFGEQGAAHLFRRHSGRKRSAGFPAGAVALGDRGQCGYRRLPGGGPGLERGSCVF